MWTRARLKENGKKLFLKNYWIYVAICFLGTLLGGTRGGTAFNVSFSLPVRDINYEGMSREEAQIAVGVLIFLAVISLIIAVIVLLFVIFVGNVVTVGSMKYFIDNRIRDMGIGEGISDMFSFFRSGMYMNVVKTMFFMELFIFLWSLLLIIPGIIKAYEYYMVPYIMAENPQMDYRDAFAISKRMMAGQKWAAFVLELSFIGWRFLALLTCGVLNIFYVTPYVNATCTELYIFSKTRAYREGYIRQ